MHDGFDSSYIFIRIRMHVLSRMNVIITEWCDIFFSFSFFSRFMCWELHMRRIAHIFPSQFTTFEYTRTYTRTSYISFLLYSARVYRVQGTYFFFLLHLHLNIDRHMDANDKATNKYFLTCFIPPIYPNEFRIVNSKMRWCKQTNYDWCWVNIDNLNRVRTST